MLPPIYDIAISDLYVFDLVVRTSSVRESARRLNVEASQVSKIIRRIETKMGGKALERSTKGVALTALGREILPFAEAVLRETRCINTHNTESHRPARTLAIGSSAFLTTYVLSPLVSALHDKMPIPNIKFRLLDIPPDQFSVVGLRGGFEMCLHLKEIDWPRSWVSAEIGRIRWVLVAHKDHAIHKRKTAAEVIKHEFVIPVYWSSEGIARGNDFCPIPASKRKIGLETATADAAFMAVQTGRFLAFLPEVFVRHRKSNVDIAEIKDWPEVSQAVHFAARSDQVLKSLFELLKDRIGKAIVHS